MATAVGFIGLGTMGKPMATNVLSAGFDLMVYDVRPEPVAELVAMGAKGADSSREVGRHAEIVELAVPDDAQVEAALLGEEGVLASARPGTVIAIHSTVHPETVRRVAGHAEARGIQVIDAQMSGGQTGALGRTLCFMVGGDKEALDRCRPVLLAHGQHVFHMGVLGMGAVTKAAQQVITVVNVLAASEGFRLAEQGGVDLVAFEQLLRVSAGRSYITDEWLERYQPRLGLEPEGETKPGIPLLAVGPADRPFYRGLRPILSLAFELDVPLPGAALAQQIVPWALGEQ